MKIKKHTSCLLSRGDRSGRSLAIGAACVVLAACGTGADGVDSDTVGAIGQAIHGGAETWNPSLVAIKTTQCSHYTDENPEHCSGILISPTAVLTAGHCVIYDADTSHPDGVDPSLTETFFVGVGCHNVTTGSGCSWVGVAQGGITPFRLSAAESRRAENDIAVIRLATRTNVAPTRLLNRARLGEVHTNDTVTINGWGLTESGNPSAVPLSAAVAVSPQTPPIQEATAFSTNRGTNPVVGVDSGDSGGPVLVHRDGEWFSMGVQNSKSSVDNHCLVPARFDWVASQVPDLPPQSVLSAAQLAAIL